MEPKLKFLLPDITTANQVAGSLMLADVDNKSISVLAKPGTDIGQLQPADSLESTNIVESTQWILFGAAIGLLGGLYIHHLYPWMSNFINMNWTALIAIAAITGAIAFIVAKTFGDNFMDISIKKYRSKIDHGEILMIVTAPFQRLNEIRLIVDKSYLRF